MGGFGFDILLFIGLMMVAWMIFVGWAASVILRIVWRCLRLIFGVRRPASAAAPAQWRWCGRLRCGAVNPIHASFCRRCGMPLAVNVSRKCQRAAA